MSGQTAAVCSVQPPRETCLSIAWRDPVVVARELAFGLKSPATGLTRSAVVAMCGTSPSRHPPAMMLGLGVPVCPCAICMKNPENTRRR